MLTASIAQGDGSPEMKLPFYDEATESGDHDLLTFRAALIETLNSRDVDGLREISCRDFYDGPNGHRNLEGFLSDLTCDDCTEDQQNYIEKRWDRIARIVSLGGGYTSDNYFVSPYSEHFKENFSDYRDFENWEFSVLNSPSWIEPFDETKHRRSVSYISGTNVPLFDSWDSDRKAIAFLSYDLIRTFWNQRHWDDSFLHISSAVHGDGFVKKENLLWGNGFEAGFFRHHGIWKFCHFYAIH